MAKLRQTIADLEAILADEGRLHEVHQDRAGRGPRTTYASPRRAELTYDEGDMNAEDLIDRRGAGRHHDPGRVREGGAGQLSSGPRPAAAGGCAAPASRRRTWSPTSSTRRPTPTCCCSPTWVSVYRLRAYEVPIKERTARGTAIVNLLPLAPGEHIQALIATRDFPEDRYLFFATRQGQVKKTGFAEYDKSRREGFIAINLRDGDELVGVIQTSGDDEVFMVSRQGMTIRFDENDVRAMGRDAAGVRGMNLRTGDEVVSADLARDDTSILMVTDAGYGKRTQLHQFNPQGRGGYGVRGIRLTAQRGRVVAAYMVGLDDDILVISSAGVMVRMQVREISSQGRDATGVKVMNLDRGQVVASVAPVLAEDNS